jgi:hypothetical protein
MCCISALEEPVEEHTISCRLETYNRIGFHLSPYEFEIDLYVNFRKL